MVPLAADHEPPMELVEAVELGLDGRGEIASRHRHLVARRAGVEGRDLVGSAAQLDLDETADLVLDLRSTAVGGLQQPGDLQLDLVGVRLDRRGDDRHPRMGVSDEAPLGTHAVDPAGVGPPTGAVDDLGLGEQVQHEALVARTTLDHHGGLAHGPAQPGQRLLAGAADRDDLGDHRVEVGRDRVALGDPGVDAYAGSRRQLEPDDAAGGRSEVAVRVLRIEPCLDCVAELARLGGVQVGEATTTRDEDLRLHEVDAGGRLGDRVLDLQAGVDLEERERPVARAVEELHGAGADVPHGQGEALGRSLDLLGLLRDEQRRGGLLDHLLVASLDRAVAHTQGPGGPVPVGDQLDLDVPGAGDEALQEDGPVAERPKGLVAGALEGVLQVVGRGHHPDAAAATSRGRLEHQRVPDLGRAGQRVLERVDGAPAPGRHRDTDLLGKQLRADLVAQPAHRLRTRADEHDAQAFAEGHERGVLGQEAPARPHRIGAGLGQGPFQHRQVDIGPCRRRPDVVGQVGLTNEHRPGLVLRVERHRLDAPVTGRVDVPHGVDQAHRRLATVRDGNAREHLKHLRHGRCWT